MFILPPAHRLISPIGLQWHTKTKVNHYLQGSVGKWFGYSLMDGFLDAHSYPHTHPCSGFLTVSSLEDLWTTWRRSSVINAAAAARSDASFAWFSHRSLPLKIFSGDEPKEKKKQKTKKRVHCHSVIQKYGISVLLRSLWIIVTEASCFLIFWMCLFDLYKVSCRWELLERRVKDLKYAAGIILTHLQ